MCPGIEVSRARLIPRAFLDDQQGRVAGIPVGDLLGGLQAFYAGQSNELYEQGFTVGEVMYDRRGRDDIGLRVADSKGVMFHRDTATGQLRTWYMPPMPNATGRRDGTDAAPTLFHGAQGAMPTAAGNETGVSPHV